MTTLHWIDRYRFLSVIRHPYSTNLNPIYDKLKICILLLNLKTYPCKVELNIVTTIYRVITYYSSYLHEYARTLALNWNFPENKLKPRDIVSQNYWKPTFGQIIMLCFETIKVNTWKNIWIYNFSSHFTIEYTTLITRVRNL